MTAPAGDVVRLPAVAAALIAAGEWRRRAACRSMPPERFDPIRSGGGPHALTPARAVADQVCAGCPVIDECSAEADLDQHPGLWGGSYRTRRHGKYLRYPLTAAAPDPLTPGAGAG